MNNKQRTNNGFTLIELMVAVVLLAMVLSFTGVIFNVSIESLRMASANAEVMQKLRAITDQLNADFGGVRTDAPLLIWFEKGPDDDPNRYDQIMFFADGDFQSTQLYDIPQASSSWTVPQETGTPIWGNTGRVQYGQARVEVVGADKTPIPRTVSVPDQLEPRERVLGRRQHILTLPPDANSIRPKEWPAKNLGDFYSDMDTYPYWTNDVYEHDSFTLAKWKTIDGSDYGAILEACFANRPLVGLYDPATYHNLMCEGVGTFAIQWAYWDDGEKRFLWFPGDDPAGDGSKPSHFNLMSDDFGVYFNIPGSIGDSDWYSVGQAASRSGEDFFPYPKALKFTFRLYDSRGLIKEGGRKGRVFTHIVYLTD